MLQSSPTIIISFSRPQLYFYCHAKFESFCYNCQHINVSYWHCTYKQFFKYTNSSKICFIRQFYFRAEKVILFARNRLRALIVLIFAHDMQIQVAHALRKQGWRLISYTANIRRVTIAACYNCPRSPLHIWLSVVQTSIWLQKMTRMHEANATEEEYIVGNTSICSI